MKPDAKTFTLRNKLSDRLAFQLTILQHLKKETSTVLIGLNTLGMAPPPMIIHKGKNIGKEWSNGAPHGTLVRVSEKGYLYIISTVSLQLLLFNYWLDGDSHIGGDRQTDGTPITADTATRRITFTRSSYSQLARAINHTTYRIPIERNRPVAAMALAYCEGVVLCSRVVVACISA